MIISEAKYTDVLDLRQRVMYPTHTIDFVKLDDDELGLHIGAFVNDKLVSVVSLFINGRDIQFRKLATLVDMQGNGYASALLNWTIEYMKEMKLARLWCNARIEASALYEKFEMVKTDKIFSRNGHDYVIMERLF